MVDYAVVDAQSIPFPDVSFDAVLVYHLLYHITDLPLALSGVRRVLRPDGHFYASTAGERHLHQLVAAIHGPNSPAFGKQAGLKCENAWRRLSPYFAHVHLYTDEGELHITEVEALVAYCLTTGDESPLEDARRLAEFVAWAERIMQEQGAVRVMTSGCLVEAH